MKKWADVLLIAPTSANMLAKLAAGMADNLLTCVARAWELRSGNPLLIAPAMNTHMWNHPLTVTHLQLLHSIGVRVVPPVSKVLACGDQGTGAMAPVDETVRLVLFFGRGGHVGHGGRHGEHRR